MARTQLRPRKESHGPSFLQRKSAHCLEAGGWARVLLRDRRAERMAVHHIRRGGVSRSQGAWLVMRSEAIAVRARAAPVVALVVTRQLCGERKQLDARIRAALCVRGALAHGVAAAATGRHSLG